MAIRRDRILKRVRALLQEHSIFSPPVPVKEIAESCGIKIKASPQSDSDLSGFIFREHGKTIIGVNSAHSKTRRRFTIAHELGHYFLHHNEGLHVDRAVQPRFRNSLSAMGTNTEEVEANTFAAELLMPRDFIEIDMKSFSGIDILDERSTEFLTFLAEKYDVSVQAITLRLTNLGYLTGYANM